MNLQIRFVDDNDQTHVIDSKQFLLSANNPRFKIIDSFNLNFKDFITANPNNLTQKEIFLKLWNQEQEKKDLLELLKSLYDKGYENNELDLICVYQVDDHYVIVEGNRRISTLKLILEEFNLPKQETSYDLDNEMDEQEVLSPENIRKIRSCLKKIRNLNQVWTVKIKILDPHDDKEAWNIVYSKHLIGKKPGYRSWSRSKYFADLLALFAFGISAGLLERHKEFVNKINRSDQQIINDFKAAQFVYACLYFHEYDHKEIKTFSDPGILEKMINLSKPSGLEQVNSLPRVKKILMNDILVVDSETFDKQYFKITYPKENNYLIQFNEDEQCIDPHDFLSLIYDFWRKGWINTRDYKSDIYKQKIIDSLRSLVINTNYSLTNVMKDEDLIQFNPFAVSIDNLKDIIILNKISHPSQTRKRELKRLECAYRVMDENNKFIEKVNHIFREKYPSESVKIEPIHVFDNLFVQYKCLSQNSLKFLNGEGCSLRSLIDEFLIWIYYYSDAVQTETDESGRTREQEYIVDMLQTRSFHFFMAVKCNYNGTEHLGFKIKQIIKEQDVFKIPLFKVIHDENNANEVYDLIKKYMTAGPHDCLNDFIHNYRAIYLKADFEESIARLELSIKLCEMLIKYVDKDMFNELNTKLIDKLRELSLEQKH